ncbi:hypothetical protein GCM10009613_16180 [Pseudonocardia kongjuensis]|uniref:Uncharacterized protein n=1 Tax=Pseudonocardia kongjuensis TaxID=102227 RepID=A0ABN1XLG2_9PSEU
MHAAGDVPGAPSVADRAVHVTEHTRGQHRVEEARPVAVADRPGPAQAQAQRPGHRAPAPRRAEDPERTEHERGQQGAGPDPAQPLQHRARADLHDQHHQQGDTTGHAEQR